MTCFTSSSAGAHAMLRINVSIHDRCGSNPEHGLARSPQGEKDLRFVNLDLWFKNGRELSRKYKNATEREGGKLNANYD